MKSSFNAYGRTNSEYGPLHIPIWLGIVKRTPVGGTLADEFNKKGALYPAGTPIQIKDKVITPLVCFKVTASTSTTVTIEANTAFGGEILPEVGDVIQKLGESFDATGKAAAVTAVAAVSGGYRLTVGSGSLDSVSEGDYITFSDVAGEGKTIAARPNAYLYHDIWLGNLDVAEDDTFATGAAVMFHPEGILIDRTPAADFKELMKAAVPGVLQVEE